MHEILDTILEPAMFAGSNALVTNEGAIGMKCTKKSRHDFEPSPKRNRSSSRSIASGLAASALAFITTSLLCQLGHAGTTDITSEAKLGEFLVQLKPGVNMKTKTSHEFIAQQLHAQIIGQVRSNLLLINRGTVETRASAIKSLKDNPLIEVVEPNFIYHASRLPNDPKLDLLWGLRNTGAKDSDGMVGIKGVDIDAERAWDITTGSDKVLVAVIDTGVDYTHPDLKDNIWVNEAESIGKPGLDDDGNGVIDDIHGADFANNDGDPMDDQSHGSHCSGTIGGRGNDGSGIVGVNWNVQIMAVKFLDKDGSGSLANAIKAIDYARVMGAKIMSNSWGGGGVSILLQKSIEDTRDAGALFVAAAGNSGLNIDVNPEYPAAYEVDNILSVAAVDNRGELADFSNYGVKHVHVAAPGVNIYSSVTSIAAQGPKDYDTYSGTSMATPHVAGIAALLLANEPEMKYQDLKTRIIDYSRPRGSLRGSVLGGMANAFFALSKQTPPPDPNDPANFALKFAITASTPHPYKENTDQVWTFKVPGAKRVAVHFDKFMTENGYDSVDFQDPSGTSYGLLSGSRSGGFGPIVNGDTVVIKFHADPSVNDYGFDADFISWE